MQEWLAGPRDGCQRALILVCGRLAFSATWAATVEAWGVSEQRPCEPNLLAFVLAVLVLVCLGQRRDIALTGLCLCSTQTATFSFCCMCFPWPGLYACRRSFVSFSCAPDLMWA